MLPKKKYVYKPQTSQSPKIKPLEPSAEIVGKVVSFVFNVPQQVNVEQDDGTVETKWSNSFADEIVAITRYEILTKKGLIIFKHALKMIVVGESSEQPDNNIGNE